MSFRTETVLVAVCDRCDGELVDPDLDEPALFTTRDDARNVAVSLLWGELGNGRLECADCAGRGPCLRYGHDWAPWAQQLVLLGRAVWTRICRHCGTDDIDPASLVPEGIAS